MARLPLISRDDLPPQQQGVYDEIQASRGGRLPNVFALLLNSPAAAARVARLGAYIRFESSLMSVQREVAALAIARELDCAYEWTAHERLARATGVGDAAIQSIGRRQAPSGLTLQEALIVRCVQELIRHRTLSEEMFQDALSLLGRQGIVDLVLTVGYYHLLAYGLLAFEVEPEPDQASPPPS